VAGACPEKGHLVGKVAVEGSPGYACFLSDCKVCGVGRADCRMQLDRCMDDLLPSRILTLGTTPKCVLPGDFRVLLCDLIIDKAELRRYRRNQYTVVTHEI
jgi:hypothetical protein